MRRKQTECRWRGAQRCRCRRRWCVAFSRIDRSMTRVIKTQLPRRTGRGVRRRTHARTSSCRCLFHSSHVAARPSSDGGARRKTERRGMGRPLGRCPPVQMVAVRRDGPFVVVGAPKRVEGGGRRRRKRGRPGGGTDCGRGLGRRRSMKCAARVIDQRNIATTPPPPQCTTDADRRTRL